MPIKGPRGFSDEKFKEKTGKTFKEWEEILDKFDVKKNGHTAAARFLKEKYNSPDWWTQAIIVKYEWEHGLKKEPVIPTDLMKSLKKNPELLVKFRKVPPSHRREYIDFIEEAKKLETRMRRIQKVLETIENIE